MSLSMAKRRVAVTRTTIGRKIKQGRSSGVLRKYKPWLTIREVPSKGMSIRIKGWKTNRVHHLFSEHFELAHFYELEWSQNILDIREQHALLPLEKTLFIAEKLNIRHPVHPKTKHPIVLTTDFVITVKTPDGVKHCAHSVKPLSKLNKRVMEKLEIERRFFEDEGMIWRLITEREINYNLVHNMRWIHSARTLESRPYLCSSLVNQVAPDLLNALSDPSVPAALSASCIDSQYNLPPGTGLFILRHMIANRCWKIDMNVRLDFVAKPVRILSCDA